MFNAENLAQIAETLFPEWVTLMEGHSKKPLKMKHKIRMALCYIFPKSEFADPLGPWDLM